MRHQLGCRTQEQQTAKCDCAPSYRGYVYHPDEKRARRGPWVKALSEARGWRIDALSALRHGALARSTSITVEEAGQRLIAGMSTGEVRNRSGRPYKPSVVRSYEASLRAYVFPELGSRRLGDIGRSDIQYLADHVALERDPSTVRNAINPLRVLYRRAHARGHAPVNPTLGIELPSVESKRDGVVSPNVANALLDALSADRELWATAFFAGLRAGELRALTCSNVDLEAGVIRVVHSWDPKVGRIEPKSKAGLRKVPIPGVLSWRLVERACIRSHGLLFGRTSATPFAPSTVHQRARRAWKAAGLSPVGLHDARHTYASLMIAAGVNAKALSTYMGHADIATTFDRYGHLMPGSEAEAAGLLDAYLTRSL